MICSIVSEKDLTTNLIIEYLNYYNIKNTSLNNKTSINNISFNISNDTIELAINEVNLTELDYLCFRRGALKFDLPICKNDLEEEYIEFVQFEYNILQEAIMESLNAGVTFNKEKYNNRISNLNLARKFNLKIPATDYQCDTMVYDCNGVNTGGEYHLTGCYA
jgi:hypothetical protein